MNPQLNPQLLTLQKTPACPFCTGPLYMLSIYGQTFSINTKYLSHLCIDKGTPIVLALPTSAEIALSDNVDIQKNQPITPPYVPPPTTPPRRQSVEREIYPIWDRKRKRDKQEKKNDPHSDRLKIPCRYHREGICAKGKDCKYLHVPKKHDDKAR